MKLLSKMWGFYTALAITVVAAAACYRLLQVLPGPVGSGNGVESPDKHYMANAMSWSDESYFGRKRNYYEFTVETNPRQILRRIVMDIPLNEDFIDWRDDGTIVWAADNSSVTYTFQGTQLTLNVKPQAKVSP